MVISCPWCGAEVDQYDVAHTQDEVFGTDGNTVSGWTFVCPDCQGGVYLPMPDDPDDAPTTPERLVKILPSRYALVAIIADLREEMA